MINEKAMASAMDKEYKKQGYNVCRDSDKLMISTPLWKVIFPFDNIPGKVLGKLAEHFAKIPPAESAWNAHESGIQSIMYDPCIQEMEEVLGQINGEDNPCVEMTCLQFKGMYLWQDDKDIIHAINPERMKLLASDKVEYSIFSAALGSVILTRECILLLRETLVDRAVNLRLCRDRWTME